MLKPVLAEGISAVEAPKSHILALQCSERLYTMYEWPSWHVNTSKAVRQSLIFF